MLLIIMSVYGILLFILAGYLLSHRNRPFLSVNIPSDSLAGNMLLTALLLIICGIVGIVAGILVSKTLALVAIAISAVFVAIFALSLVRSIN